MTVSDDEDLMQSLSAGMGRSKKLIRHGRVDHVLSCSSQAGRL